MGTWARISAPSCTHARGEGSLSEGECNQRCRGVCLGGPALDTVLGRIPAWRSAQQKKGGSCFHVEESGSGAS